jgi:multidrug transporter EmrE-like cation transporter
MEYLYIIIAALCIGVQFNINKVYAKVSPKGVLGALIFPALTTIVGAILLLCINLFNIKFTVFGVIMASIGSIVSVLSLMVGILATGRGRVSVYTTFLMLGGMFLPYVYGLCSGDSVTVGKIIGMCVLIGALILSILPTKQEKENKQPLKVSFVVLCAIAFILNGCTSIISNIHQKNVAMQMPTFDYVITGYLIQFVLASVAVIVAYFIAKSKNDKTEMQAPVIQKGSFVKKALIVLGVCTAFTVVSTGGFLLQLIANKTLDPSMLYPFVTGGSTVFSTVIAFIVFKEKINLNVLISLVLMLAGTILFMF